VAAPLVIAHRAGARHDVENSLVAIARAQGHGADAVEIDVRRTLDGVAVLQHDLFPVRTMRWPLPLFLLPARLATRLRLRADGRLPTLAAAFDAAPPGLGFAIELKEPSAARSTLVAVQGPAAAGRPLMSWSKFEAVARFFARELSEVPGGMEITLLRDGQTRDSTDRFLADAHEWGATGVCVSARLLHDGVFAVAERRGLRVYTGFGTLRRQESVLAEGWPLAGFTTDWPAEAKVGLAAASPEEDSSGGDA